MAVPHLWSDTWHFREVSDGDLLSLWGEGKTNELWEGQLVQEEMTAPYHGVVANEIGRQIQNYLQQQQIDAHTVQHVLFNLTRAGQSRMVLAPDVAIFPVGASIPRRAIPTFAPWLAVEILSPTQTVTQMRIKCQVYLQAGTVEAWIVDPELEQIEV